MPDYQISFARSARKELQELDSRMAARVLDVIESLTVEPRPSGCRKIRASTDLFRVRVGNYRVIYRVDDAGRLVDVIGIRHRGDAY